MALHRNQRLGRRHAVDHLDDSRGKDVAIRGVAGIHDILEDDQADWFQESRAMTW